MLGLRRYKGIAVDLFLGDSTRFVADALAFDTLSVDTDSDTLCADTGSTKAFKLRAKEAAVQRLIEMPLQQAHRQDSGESDESDESVDSTTRANWLASESALLGLCQEMARRQLRHLSIAVSEDLARNTQAKDVLTALRASFDAHLATDTHPATDPHLAKIQPTEANTSPHPTRLPGRVTFVLPDKVHYDQYQQALFACFDEV